MPLKPPIIKPIPEIEEEPTGRLGGHEVFLEERLPTVPTLPPGYYPPPEWAREIATGIRQPTMPPPVSREPLFPGWVSAAVEQTTPLQIAKLAERVVSPEVTGLPRMRRLTPPGYEPSTAEQIASGALSMAIDPLTYLAGGAGRWAREAVKKAAPTVAAKVGGLLPRAAGGAAFFGTYEAGRSPLLQLVETGEISVPQTVKDVVTGVAAGAAFGAAETALVAVTRHLYHAAVTAVGRNIADRGFREFGESFFERFEPLRRQYAKGEIAQADLIKQANRAIKDLRAEGRGFTGPRSTESPRTRLKQLAQATRGGPGAEAGPLTPVEEAGVRWGALTPKQRGDIIERASIRFTPGIAAREWWHIAPREQATLANVLREWAARQAIEQPTIAMQAGMGIGEAPTQGEIFAEFGAGAPAQVPPLIEREPLEARAAREAEIARGQAEMAVPKEPWEMTREVFINEARNLYPDRLLAHPQTYHKGLVKKALSEGKPVPPEVLADYPDLAPKPVPKRPWEISASQYQAEKGVLQPHIGEISQTQYAGMSKRAKAAYEKKRAAEWDASAAVKTEWREQVLAAYKEGRITLETAGLSGEAKSAITLGRISEREAVAEQALKDALERNRISSIDDVSVGDRVHDLMSRTYGTVTKKFKNSVRLKLDTPLPAARGRPPITEMTVNARALEWQRYDDVKAGIDRAVEPTERPVAPAEAEAELTQQAVEPVVQAAAEPNIEPVGRQRVRVSLKDLEYKPEIFQARDADPGKAVSEQRVKQLLDAWDPNQFSPPSVVADPDNPGKYIVYRGHHRAVAYERIHGADASIEVYVTAADITNPDQLQAIQLEGDASNFKTALPNFRETVRAVQRAEAAGLSQEDIGGRLRKSKAEVEALQDAARLGPPVIDRVTTEATLGPAATELGRAMRLYEVRVDEAEAWFRRIADAPKGQRPTTTALRETIDKYGKMLKDIPPIMFEGFEGFEGTQSGILALMDESAKARTALTSQARRVTNTAKRVTELTKAPGTAKADVAAAQRLVRVAERQEKQIEKQIAELDKGILTALREAEGLPQPVTPSRARVPAEAGGALRTEAMRVPPSVQPAGPQVSTQALVPSPTMREAAPSTITGALRISNVGDIDSTSKRIILQPLDDVKQLQAQAGSAEPELRARLQTVTTEVPGSDLVGLRTKDMARIQEKIAAGKPAETISDYLGARIAVSTLEDVDRLVQSLRRVGRIVEDEDFLATPNNGYRARHVQLEMPNGMTAEVQIVPRELADVQEEAHGFYEALRSPSAPQAEVEAAQAQAETIMNGAWDRFAERAVAPMAEAPTEYTADVLRDPPAVQLELAMADTAEAAELERNIVRAAQQDVDAYGAAKIALERAAADSGLPPPRDPPAIASHGGAGNDNPPGTFSEMIFGFPGEANERAALRKWAGSRDTLALETQEWWEQGQDRLRELGVGTQRGEAQMCTEDEMEGLFKALHGEGDVPENLRPIYDDIKRLLDQETSDMIAMDPTFQRFLMAHPDYFPRGWRAPKVTPSGRTRLGAKPGFLKPRIDATFSEMLDAAWEPISWNPYDMVALRRISGVEYRENMLLVQRFKTWGKIAPSTEAPPDWRVPRVGPAFEGRPFAMKDGKVGFTPRLAVPDRIADSLEGVYGFRPSMYLGGVDLVPWLRRVSNAPKRAKLFASLFQHADFMTRAGGVAFTPTGLMRGLPLKYPSLVARLMNVSLRKTPRAALRAKMLSGDPLYKDFDISLRMIAEEGWQIGGDPSMLRRTMLSALNEAVKDVPEGAEKSLVRNAAERVKGVARFFEDGLFDGVYRETMSWALENFIVPRLRKMHPDWDARQIAGAAAQETNIMFSSLGEWQTVFSHPAMKELSRAFIFSTNETEGWIRGAIGTVKGPNKRLWREYAIGMLLFFGAVANAINILSTGKPMPMDTYLPIRWNNPYSYLPGGLSYNTRFMSPQLPWKGKDGRPLYLDIVGQADTFIRWILDPPGAVMARTNVIPRMITNQIKGETFWGTPLRGAQERFKAALVDLGLPISASSGLGGLAEAVPGLKGILPELGEPRLGVPGGFVQATGLNLRAGTNQEIRDAIARGSGLKDTKGNLAERWEDLSPSQQVALKGQYPEFEAMERESKERFAERGIIDLSRDIKAGQQVQSMLDKGLQKALDSANEDVGPLSHSLTIPETGGERYYLSDEQFKDLQDATAKAINQLAKKAMATSTWKRASPEQQANILDKVIKDGRAVGRAEIFKALEGRETRAPTPTTRSPLPDWLKPAVGVTP